MLGRIFGIKNQEEEGPAPMEDPMAKNNNIATTRALSFSSRPKQDDKDSTTSLLAGTHHPVLHHNRTPNVLAPSHTISSLRKQSQQRSISDYQHNNDVARSIPTPSSGKWCKTASTPIPITEIVQTCSRNASAVQQQQTTCLRLRGGKWIPEEIEYAGHLVKLFIQGVLQDCRDGASLRSYLSHKLRCTPTRVSKKFSGKGIGKLQYRQIAMMDAYSADRLRALERQFHVATTKFPPGTFAVNLLSEEPDVISPVESKDGNIGPAPTHCKSRIEPSFAEQIAPPPAIFLPLMEPRCTSIGQDIPQSLPTIPAVSYTSMDTHQPSLTPTMGLQSSFPHSFSLIPLIVPAGLGISPPQLNLASTTIAPHQLAVANPQATPPFPVGTAFYPLSSVNGYTIGIVPNRLAPSQLVQLNQLPTSAGSPANQATQLQASSTQLTQLEKCQHSIEHLSDQQSKTSSEERRTPRVSNGSRASATTPPAESDTQPTSSNQLLQQVFGREMREDTASPTIDPLLLLSRSSIDDCRGVSSRLHHFYDDDDFAALENASQAMFASSNDDSIFQGLSPSAWKNSDANYQRLSGNMATGTETSENGYGDDSNSSSNKTNIPL